MNPSDDELREILRRSRVAVCIGASLNPARPSHFVSVYLRSRGLRVIPVNPGHAGGTLFGETIRADLRSIPEGDRAQVDFLDLFRCSEAVPPIVDEALEVLPNLRTVWMQVGVRNEAAAEAARARGIDVVQDRCPKVEFPRLLG